MALAAANAWHVVGYFGRPSSEIPLVLPMASLDPSATLVVGADLIDDVEYTSHMTLAEFDEYVATEVATLLPPFMWDRGGVLFASAGGPVEWVSVWEAEFMMKRFVTRHRAEGRAALDRGDQKGALEAYDRARRVSSEREDIEMVASLSPEPEMQQFFTSAL
jgi:hypothetical protein